MVANAEKDVTRDDLVTTLLDHASVRPDRVKIRNTVAHRGDDGTWGLTARGNLPATFALSAAAVTPQQVASEIAKAKAEAIDRIPG